MAFKAGDSIAALRFVFRLQLFLGSLPRVSILMSAVERDSSHDWNATNKHPKPPNNSKPLKINEQAQRNELVT